MELKYYIGFNPYFVDGKQVIGLCDNYYFSTDGKTCYGFDSEGKYYVAKRIDAISPLVTFEQNSEGGINVVMSFPGEEPVVESASGDAVCCTFDTGYSILLFFVNHMRMDDDSPAIRWSSFDVCMPDWSNKNSNAAAIVKIGTTSEFWFSNIE